MNLADMFQTSFSLDHVGDLLDLLVLLITFTLTDHQRKGYFTHQSYQLISRTVNISKYQPIRSSGKQSHSLSVSVAPDNRIVVRSPTTGNCKSRAHIC